LWILVAEDDIALGQLLRQGLEEQNHSVVLVLGGLEARTAARTSHFDVAVLDVMMPGMNGIDVVKHLRADGNGLPVLLLTARDAATDVVRGLDAGADDYLTKPFAFKVLLARIRAIARRATRPLVPRLEVGDLVLDPATREVARAGQVISLTATEFRVLEFLMRRSGHAACRSAIIEAVWGFDEDVEANTVDVYIKLLRDKIDCGRSSKLIQTVRGYGYILREPA
jgi:DNA-binding response OmpR family regulator